MNTPPLRKLTLPRTRPERGGDTVEYIIVLLVVLVIAAGLIAFGGTMGSQVTKTGQTIDSWFSKAGVQNKPKPTDPDDVKYKPDPNGGTAFAVYSADDQSLDFYKRDTVPAEGSSFKGKTVNKVFTGFETDVYASRADVPWKNELFTAKAVKVVDEGIKPKSMSRWFDCADVKDGSGNYCAPLKDIDVKKIKTTECIEMRSLFQACTSLTSLDLSNFDTSSVTDMAGMFNACLSLTSLDVSSWNTSNVGTMHALFQFCTSLTTITGLENWNTEHVAKMSYMFSHDERLESVGDLSNWDVSSVTDMQQMFCMCNSLKSPGRLDNWNVSNVTSMRSMFGTYIAGSELKHPQLEDIGDISNWDVSNVTDMTRMFQSQHSLKSVGSLKSWDTGKVTSMTQMFGWTLSLSGVDASNWDVSNVTDHAEFDADSAGVIAPKWVN